MNGQMPRIGPAHSAGAWGAENGDDPYADADRVQWQDADGKIIIVAEARPEPTAAAQQQAQRQQSPTVGETQEYVRQQARASGLPEALALGLVQKESNFDTNARGGRGEAGLFQIMPTFNGHVLRDAHGNQLRVNLQEARTNWQYNVQVGIAILNSNYRWAQSHVSNDVIAATYAHYNGGNRGWRYYQSPRSPVHQHVYGSMQHRAHHAPQYIPGYMDYYHQWGGH
jgi:soluble lytic murein transglycosylase-like protein